MSNLDVIAKCKDESFPLLNSIDVSDGAILSMKEHNLILSGKDF